MTDLEGIKVICLLITFDPYKSLLIYYCCARGGGAVEKVGEGGGRGAETGGRDEWGMGGRCV